MTRKSNPSDRREKLVRTTSACKAIIKDMRQELDIIQHKAFDGFSEEQRLDLLDSLAKIVSNLSSQADEPDQPEQPSESEQAEQPEQSDQPDQPNQCDEPIA